MAKNAFKEPRQIDMDLVDAQQLRRVLDRIVGYSLRSFFGKRLKRTFAGRVQSLLLKLIIDRETKLNISSRKNIGPLMVYLQKGTPKLAYGIDGKKMKLNTNEEVKAVLERSLDGKDFTVEKVEKERTC